MNNEELKNAIEYIEDYIEDFKYDCQHQKETHSAINSDDEEFKDTLKILENIRDELKAQKTPKKYLTYKEAMKLNPNKTYKVILNGRIYDFEIDRDNLELDTPNKYYRLYYTTYSLNKEYIYYHQLTSNFCDDKQFFNDLHLELVEE